MTFSSCQIYNNTADNGSGGGVKVDGGDVTFTSCEIHNNLASSWGGGVLVGRNGGKM